MVKKFFLLVIVFFLFVPPVHAQESDLPNPGILPTSPWYRFELFFEQIGEVIIFDKTAKAQRLLMHAEERLAELAYLAEEENTENVEELLTEYEDSVTKAVSLANEAQHEGRNVDDVLEKVSTATLKHQAVLARVYEKVPEQARPAIERAMQNSLRGHENATEAVSGEKREEVEEQVEETRLHVEEKLQSLREEGKPIPPITIPRGRPDTIPPEGENQEKRGEEQSNAQPDLPQQGENLQDLPEKAQVQVRETVTQKVEDLLPL